jgi:hypothetical protein
VLGGAYVLPGCGEYDGYRGLFNLFMLDLFIIVFGGGRRGGCSTTGCLFWILFGVVLSVGLTIL